VGDAGRRGTRELAAFAAAHFEHRDAFGNQDIRGERRELVHLAPFEGSGIDPVDDPMRCADNSNLHVNSSIPYAKTVPEAQDEF
jgi:hypothetical protein